MTVTRLFIADSIEDRILRLQEKKQLVFEGTYSEDDRAIEILELTPFLMLRRIWLHVCAHASDSTYCMTLHILLLEYRYGRAEQCGSGEAVDGRPKVPVQLKQVERGTCAGGVCGMQG